MLESLTKKQQYGTTIVVPTYWCTNCQLTLRSRDERQAHVKLFPTHAVKAVDNLVCPRCGNYLPLDRGAFPDHWVGGSHDMRKCGGSGKLA